MIRIGQYNNYLLQIKLMMETEQIDKKFDGYSSKFQEMKNDLDSIKTQYLEYLAFFSSVLAFILASVNIVIQIDDFNKSAVLMLMFAGVLIIVFSIFRMLLYFLTKIRFGVIKLVICYFFGTAFIIVGYHVGNHICFWLY